MARNVKAIIDGVKVSPYYDINTEEIKMIIEYSKTGKEELYETLSPCNLVVFGFLYGYEMGHRAAIAESRKGGGNNGILRRSRRGR